MASKFVIHTLPFVLLLLALVLVHVQTLQLISGRRFPRGPREEHVLIFKPSETKVTVDVNQITKAVWDAAAGGYKIMSLILQNHLSSVVPFGCDYDCSTVTVYNNNTITVFVPPDESFIDDASWKNLEYQFVSAKVDKEAFDSGSVRTGSELLTCHWRCNVVVSGYGSINNVAITHWNIYNDGHIIVHGVQDFFHC